MVKYRKRKEASMCKVVVASNKRLQRTRLRAVAIEGEAKVKRGSLAAEAQR
jgi:hypothetical protein